MEMRTVPFPLPPQRHSRAAPFSPKWNYTRRANDRFYDLRDEKNSRKNSFLPPPSFRFGFGKFKQLDGKQHAYNNIRRRIFDNRGRGSFERRPGPGHLISASFEKWLQTSADRLSQRVCKKPGVKNKGRAINAMETSTPPLCRGFGRITPLIFLPTFFLPSFPCNATLGAVFQEVELYIFVRENIRFFFFFLTDLTVDEI